MCLYELLTGNNPFFLGAETVLANSPEFDRSQFESAVDRATLTMEPDLSCIGAASAQSVGVVGSVYLEGNIKSKFNSRCAIWCWIQIVIVAFHPRCSAHQLRRK